VCVPLTITEPIYEGDTMNGLKHGFGTILDSSRNVVFCGDFVQDQYHGHGVLNNPYPSADKIDFKQL
jgi:hypothetical protein